MGRSSESAKSVAELDSALAWEILKELGESERHFNSLEAQYRTLASIWLLAGFAGIGFLLKQDPGIAVPRELAIGGVGLAVSIGIFLLWIVDLLVYHRLLDACFSEAKNIERAHPELPQVRSSMGRSQRGGRVVTTRLRWFYIALTAAPLVFSMPFVVSWCLRERGATTAVNVSIAVVLFFAILAGAIWTKSLRNHLEKRAS